VCIEIDLTIVLNINPGITQIHFISNITYAPIPIADGYYVGSTFSKLRVIIVTIQNILNIVKTWTGKNSRMTPITWLPINGDCLCLHTRCKKRKQEKDKKCLEPSCNKCSPI